MPGGDTRKADTMKARSTTPPRTVVAQSPFFSRSRSVFAALAVAAGAVFGSNVAHAADGASFVDDFDKLDRARWFISDGWTNGDHQNCTWSKDQIKAANGILELSFEKRTLKDRDFACGEIQTKQRFSYGTYEARMKTDTGSGLNAAFFTFIGPVDKQPHDEIDFEVLTKDTSKVQVNVYISGKGNNEAFADVSGGTDQAFNDYAFVWEPDRLRWYVNGQLVNTVTDPAKLPSHAQKIFFSLWGSDTLTQWMGPFTDPGRKVTLAVDRVAFTALGQPCQFPESVACGLK